MKSIWYKRLTSEVLEPGDIWSDHNPNTDQCTIHTVGEEALGLAVNSGSEFTNCMSGAWWRPYFVIPKEVREELSERVATGSFCYSLAVVARFLGCDLEHRPAGSGDNWFAVQPGADLLPHGYYRVATSKTPGVRALTEAEWKSVRGLVVEKTSLLVPTYNVTVAHRYADEKATAYVPGDPEDVRKLYADVP